MIMLSLLPTMVLAEERDKTYDVTLGEIQQELIDYASIAGSKIVPGTDSYYDYVVNQLLNHSDQKLCEHPHYDLIHAYIIISIPTSFTTLGSLTIRTQILRAVWILVVPSLLMIPMFNL